MSLYQPIGSALADAVQSYLFNAQLVTLPESGGMALILPTEAQSNPRVWGWLEEHVAGNGPIRRLIPVDVRQSMANGGGPACLRLRVVADPATVDATLHCQRSEAGPDGRCDCQAIGRRAIAPSDQLADRKLSNRFRLRGRALLSACGLSELA